MSNESDDKVDGITKILGSDMKINSSDGKQSNKPGGRNVQSQINERNFEGQTPEIGGILALRGESNIKKRVYYDKFKELLVNYVTKELKEPGDVICAINDLEDPLKEYEKSINQRV